VQIRQVADAQKLGVSLIHQELNNFDNLDIGGKIFLGGEPLSGGRGFFSLSKQDFELN
jgi:ABC-type sugar transport system ATPase subunit